MAAVTHAVTTQNANPLSSYVSTAFTPASGDLLLFIVTAKGTVITPTATDSQGLGMTLVTSALFNTSADSHHVFVSNNLAAASSMTCTFDCTGDAATRADSFVARVSGITRTGSSAIRQSNKSANQTASPVSSPLFGVNCLTGNPTIESMGSNESGMTPPTNWTERADVQNTEYHSRDSGFTGTNIGWADTVVSGYAIVVLEIDTSSAAATDTSNDPAFYKQPFRFQPNNLKTIITDY